MDKAPIKCAIYTRKSSEEGLEQSFNSLAAQREACRAFILSQKHEGWVVLKDTYDDGGISGGTMERPALQKLLKDIQDGNVNTVVVYKVDRLTRSLMDFARIIEIFDSKSVSFVSVTQQFNTTSSMGRLTLNVLLSFAQFEREITGERIRDKIAASKKKGMWMGGTVPLGYSSVNRSLTVNQAEAETVITIFKAYLRFGCLTDLKKHLEATSTRSKMRTSQKGRTYGGANYSRGALHHVLSNRIYLGEIVHRDKHFPGKHQPIVPRTLWNRVAARLAENNNAQRRKGSVASSSILSGMLYDSSGIRFTPTHSRKQGKRYRYYTSQAVIQRPGAKAAIARVPAQELEDLVEARVRGFLAAPESLLRHVTDGAVRDATSQRLRRLTDNSTGLKRLESRLAVKTLVSRVVLGQAKLWVEINRDDVIKNLKLPSQIALNWEKSSDPVIKLEADFQFRRRGPAIHIVTADDSHRPQSSIPSIVTAVVRAKGWYEGVVRGEFGSVEEIATGSRLTKRYVRKVLRCAFLSPTVIEGLLSGSCNTDVTLKTILAKLPSDWKEQQRRLLNR